MVQQLVTKFQADSDIDSINRINDAFLALQESRAQKLSSSRDLLHRTHTNTGCDQEHSYDRMDEEGGDGQVGGSATG